MARKKLKKYRMAVGLCGPQILYTNIIKAYTAEEAAIKYYEELGEEVSEEKLAETARQMYEIEDEKPLEAYYDCRKEPFGIGDNIFAILKEDKSHPAICRATVTALTNRGIKVFSNEKEYPIFVGKNDDFDLDGKTVPFFAKIIKITEDMSPEGVLEIGNQVAFMEKEYMGNCHGFLFGTVERITDSFVFIINGETVVRKAPSKIQKLS